MKRIVALLSSVIIAISPILADAQITNGLNNPYTPSSSAQGQILPFSPTWNGGLKLWFDATDYSSLTLSGSNVTQINDKSGNANNATESGGLAPPVWTSTQFNNSAGGLGSSAAVGTSMIVADAASIQDIFAGGGEITGTFIITGSGQTQKLYSKFDESGSTYGTNLIIYGNGNTVTPRFTVGTSGNYGQWDFSGAIYLNVPYSFVLQYNSSTLATAPKLWLNGVLQTSSVVQAPTGTYGSDAGHNLILMNRADASYQPLLGTLGEFAMYNGVQSSTMLATVQSFFGALSGIPTANVYFLTGDSEIVGNNTTVPYTTFAYAPGKTPAQNPLIWNGSIFDALAPSKNSNNQYINAIGPELSFGATLSGIIGQRAYIVKYAVGGTTLYSQWSPTGPGAQWTVLLAQIAATMPYLANQGMIPVVAAFVSDIGVNDAKQSNWAAAYQTNLTNFIPAVSTAFAGYTLSPDYKFILMQSPNTVLSTFPYVSTIQAAQATVAKNTGSPLVVTTDLPLISDGTHLTTAGEITVGSRFANAITSLFPIYTGSWLNTNPNTGGIVSNVLTSGNAVSLTTATSANVVSMMVPAGDWDISGEVDYILGAATATLFKSGTNTTSGTLGGQDSYASVPLITTLVSSTYTQVAPSTRYTFTQPTVVYMVGNATFSAGTVTAYGTIRARKWK
jgi:hypothetical protein